MATAPTTSTEGSNEVRKPRSAVQRVVATSRLPHLLKNQIKVIMRPRGGLDITSVDLVLLARAITIVAALTEQQAKEVAMCPNKMQNILVISTPHKGHAAAYAKVQRLYMSTRMYEVAAYVAALDLLFFSKAHFEK